MKHKLGNPGPYPPAPILSLLLSALLSPSFSASPEGSFLVISSPRNSKISWIRLPPSGNFEGHTPEALIDDGLETPQGVAVDQRRKWLYVADPSAKSVYGYKLGINRGALEVDPDSRVSVITGVEARWVAVDSNGDVFASDEPNNRILKVSSSSLFLAQSKSKTTDQQKKDSKNNNKNSKESASSSSASSTGKLSTLFSARTTTAVDGPGGLASDNFHVFWTNKHFGEEAGSLVRGSFDLNSTVTVLAKNAVKCFGVCIAMNNVFYTDAEQSLYAVKKTGGKAAEISNQLENPRGCAWDGDSTLYVADRGRGVVYSLASNMHALTTTALSKSFEMEDAFGMAVLHGGAYRGGLSSIFLALLGGWLSVWLAN